jgi:hypothetical protein
MSSLLDLTLGGMEVGILLSSVLFGMTTVQVYNYYKLEFKDNVYVYSLVCRFAYYFNFVIELKLSDLRYLVQLLAFLLVYYLPL